MEDMNLQKREENLGKKLLNMGKLTVIVSLLFFIELIIIAIVVDMSTLARILIICFGLVVFCAFAVLCVIIEQKVGYYKCAKCNHTYKPTFKQALWAMHLGRTKYVKCPHCGERSWNKKVLTETKEDE